MKRYYHHWEKWECYKAGFFNNAPPEGLSSDDCKSLYCEFLSDLPRFLKGIRRVFKEWKYSCEQFLSNTSINRIAWIGQSAMCIETGIPSCFRGGFKLLTETQQQAANELARKCLVLWLEHNVYEK